MGSRSTTQSSAHSDRSVTRDGHVIPNLSKSHTTATAGHANTFRTGESTAVNSAAPGTRAIHVQGHTCQPTANSQAIQFAN